MHSSSWALSCCVCASLRLFCASVCLRVFVWVRSCVRACVWCVCKKALLNNSFLVADEGEQRLAMAQADRNIFTHSTCCWLRGPLRIRSLRQKANQCQANTGLMTCSHYIRNRSTYAKHSHVLVWSLKGLLLRHSQLNYVLSRKVGRVVGRGQK